MQTVVDNSSNIALEQASIVLRLTEVDYLLLNLTVLANQLVLYRVAESEVTEYGQTAAGATAFVGPKVYACLFLQYDILFEEIKFSLFLCMCICAVIKLYLICMYETAVKCMP